MLWAAGFGGRTPGGGDGTRSGAGGGPGGVRPGRAWSAARDAYLEADRQAPLDIEDLDRCAVAAHLVGDDERSVDLLARGFQLAQDRDDRPAAVRAAVRAAFRLLNAGEVAQAGGWLARAQRVLADAPSDSVEHGLLLVPQAVQHLLGGHPADAYRMFGEAARIGERFRDPDLTALSYLGQGHALIALGKVADGVALLDELMVLVTSSAATAFAYEHGLV